MKKTDLLEAFGNIDEKYLTEAQERAEKTERASEAGYIIMGVEIMNKTSVWKKTIPAVITVAIVLTVGMAVYQREENDFVEESSSGSSIPVTESSSTTPSPQNTIESESDNAVEVSDGIYRISSVPRKEEVNICSEYGVAKRSKGAEIQLSGRTLDFSSIPDKYNNDFLPYCVYDESTVYFADFKDFYKSDIEMNSPTLLFTMTDEQDTLPDYIDELISVPNTDLLFFSGFDGGEACVGSIDPETCKADFISCKSKRSVLCNTGVMLYGTAAKNSGSSSTVWYWERGEFYEITLQNPAEIDFNVYVSANGKYICTYMWGTTEDSRLVERYSVYDVKSGKLIRSFDWTFKSKVIRTLPSGFTFWHINEETQSVYLRNTEDNELYQFYFGG